MNDTIISRRIQAIICQLIAKPQTRGELELALRETNPSSKITILRDLNSLIKMNWVKSTGAGRSTKYLINEKYSLLIPLSLDFYFSEGSSIRQYVKESFDETIFSKLCDLFTDEEIKTLQGSKKSLARQKSIIGPTIFQKELERLTIEFSWKSSRIEGNTYTLLETEQLIKQKQQAAGHPKEEAIMILNHKDALSFVLENPSQFDNLSVDKIIEIHSLMIKDLPVTSGIRSHRVGISGTNYLPPSNKEAIEKYLRKTVSFINKLNNPFTKALTAISMISYLQPFTDGNKRTGRMIANAILIAYDLIPLSYRDIDELEYKKALIVFYEQNNIFNFKRIFVNQYLYSNTHYFQ